MKPILIFPFSTEDKNILYITFTTAQRSYYLVQLVLLNNTRFTDIYSGYLIFRRTNINPSKLRTDGWEQQAEILSKIIRKSSKIHDVPIVYHGRTYEEGKKIKPRHILHIIGTIIREKILPTEN